MPGMLRSRITIGENSRRSDSSAAAPLAATLTSYPEADTSVPRCSRAISSSSTTSTRGGIPVSAGWICVIADSSAAELAEFSVAFTAADSQLQRGTRLAQLRAQAVGVHAGVDARHELGLAHVLGQIV